MNTIYHGITSAFENMGELVVNEIEIVKVYPRNPNSFGKEIAEVQVIISDPMRQDTNGRFSTAKFEEVFSYQEVARFVIKATMELLDKRDKRLQQERNHLETVQNELRANVVGSY